MTPLSFKTMTQALILLLPFSTCALHFYSFYCVLAYKHLIDCENKFNIDIQRKHQLKGTVLD